LIILKLGNFATKLPPDQGNVATNTVKYWFSGTKKEAFASFVIPLGTEPFI
jgi:hypothetical protein